MFQSHAGSDFMVGKKITVDQKRKIKELYESIKNGHAVGREMGLGSTTVYNHLSLGKCTHPIWTDDEIQIMVDGYLDKMPVQEIARKIGRSPRAVMVKMCRYRKQIRKDPKKRRALSAISMALKAVRKADIFREVVEDV